MIELRPYQRESVEKTYQFLKEHPERNPAIVCPTGAGKSVIIAQMVSDVVGLWSGRVMVLTHVQELVAQNAKKIRCHAPDLEVGIYSAGLRRRETEPDVVCAGIQSVYKRVDEFAPFDLVIIDEAHLVPPEGEGMYRQFLESVREANPDVRVVGLTATPYRMKSGLICAPGNILEGIAYEIGVRELIRDGYLCPLVPKAGRTKVDTDSLHVRGGEFVHDEVETLMNQEEVVESACDEIVELTRDRHGVLLFASGVDHAKQIVRVLEERHSIDCGFVCGETPKDERADTLDRFLVRELKYLVNVNVLTTGFDAPHVDCVAMLRPTMSPGLMVQQVGRGFRLHPGKKDCLVLDFAGNILRHGPIDRIRVRDRATGNSSGPRAKECPECQLLVALGYSVCPECGYEFTSEHDSQVSHDPTASNAGVLSDQRTDTEFEVRDIRYSVHRKHNAPEDAPRTMRVQYRLGLHHWQSEFICFEHKGYARGKAVGWWTQRSSDPVPKDAEEAVVLAEARALCFTEKITVRSSPGERYDRIVGYVLGPKPEGVEAVPLSQAEFEEVPF